MPATKTKKQFSIPVQGMSLSSALQFWYEEVKVAASAARLAELERIQAPEIIIENERKLASKEHWQGKGANLIKKAEKKNPGISNLTAEKFELKKGRGGKVWFHIHTQQGVDVAFFPDAPYGAFVKVGIEK